MNPSTSTSESGATISVSGSRGAVGISPTGIELGINAGIGQLGISTDYGGGIVIGIGGQKIVWGREGGYIEYKFPGLEVIIEARDCVVVETRKVLGQVVVAHTYPDPGCKLPPEPDPPKPDPPKPPPPPGTPLPKPPTPDLSCSHVFPSWKHNDFSLEDALRQLYPWLYGDLSDTEMAQLFGVPTAGLSSVFVEQLMPVKYFSSITGRDDFTGNADVMGVFSGWHNIIDEDGRIILHKVDAIEIFFARKIVGYDYDRRSFIWSEWAYSGEWRHTLKCASAGNQPPPSGNQPPPSGNRPPMPQDCCKELAADLADVKEVLAVKEILEGKLTFPWRLRMPGGRGDEVIKDYPNLARAIVQVIDHLGIHPPKLDIKDINNAIAGDQSISNQFPCATQGFEALMAQVWDANADVDTLTNFLYRLSWLCVQQSVNLAVLSGDIQSIKDMLGGATERDSTSITTPFNIGAGIKEVSTKGKGFGKSQGNRIDKKIDENTEFSTESLLPEFLKIRENEIIIDKFSGKQDIYDLLSLIILKLETLSAR
jgi:hypothetical protein